MRSIQEVGQLNLIGVGVRFGYEPRVPFIELDLVEFGVVPALNEMAGDVACCRPDDGTGHVVPGHTRRRMSIHCIVEGLVQIAKIFDNKIDVILAYPQFGTTIQPVGQSVLIGAGYDLTDEIVFILRAGDEAVASIEGTEQGG